MDEVDVPLNDRSERVRIAAEVGMEEFRVGHGVSFHITLSGELVRGQENEEFTAGDAGGGAGCG